MTSWGIYTSSGCLHGNSTWQIKWFRFLIGRSINLLINLCQCHNNLGSFTMTDPIFLKDFFMWAIFKLIIEFVTILLLFYVLIFFFFWPQGTWGPSSLIKDRTYTCLGRQSSNHWTSREVPSPIFLHDERLINHGTRIQTQFCLSINHILLSIMLSGKSS